MIRSVQNQYQPDFVSPPGETLLETLETLGMSQAALAERTGKSLKTINEIVRGKAPITPETALQLEHVLGVPAPFWNNRERQYQEWRARADEREQLSAHVAWLDEIPLKSMLDFGWLRADEDPVEQLREALRFFGVAAPDRWRELWLNPQAAFRSSPAFQAEPGAVAAWLRRGEIEAQRLDCEPFDAGRFRAALVRIRTLTSEPPEVFQPEIVRLCAQAGVAVVFVPELPKIRTSGAVRWLTPTKAVLQLCLRYKSDDQLWFTLFHEAGHILLHGKREVFIDDGDGAEGEKEQQASRFAADQLIPPTQWRRFGARAFYSKEAIIAFAEEAGIAPGIVVGRLQHEGLMPVTHCNGLKRRLQWVSPISGAIVIKATDTADERC